jgi:GT2 family glycosyltransferase
MEENQAPGPPRVSAVVLSYNTAASLRRCLSALEASSIREQMEIIVVDAASQDESPRLDAEFPNVAFQRMPRNFGATKALNIGARTALGEQIFFIAPEVEVDKDTAVRLAAHLEANAEIAAVCPALFTPDGRPAHELHKLPTPDLLKRAWHDPEALPDIEPDLSDGPVSVQFPSRAALMVRKFNLRSINYLDEKYGQFWADADLSYQILKAGKKIFLIPDARAIVHPGEDLDFSSSARALLDVDRATGASRYASKYFGFMSGLGITIGAALHSMGQMLAFRDPGFQASRLIGILSRKKVDGTQTSL